MNIVFNNIKMHNFMNFEDSEVSFSSHGFIVVKGENYYPQDASSSNGSGKSSIFEAISWSLTGETIRGNKDVVRRGDNDGCFVECNFSIDSDDYSIIRYKDHKKFKSNLKFFINSKDFSGKGVRDTQQIINNYLPDVNSQLLNAVIIMGQGLPMRFSNNTPSGRKEILEKLSKSDFMIDDIKNKVAKRYNYLSGLMRELEDNKLSLESKQSTLDTLLKDTENKLKYLKPVDDIKIELNDILDEISKKTALIDSIENEKLNINDEFGVLKNNDAFVDNEKVYRKEYEESKLSIEKIVNDKVKPLEDNNLDLKNKIYSLRNEISRLDSIVDVCPTCGQKIPNVSKIDTSDKKEELKKLKEESENLDRKIRLVKEEGNNSINNFKKSYDEKVNYLNLKCKEALNELSSKDRELSTIKSDINTLEKTKLRYNSLIDEYDINKNNLTTIIEDTKSKIEECNNDILYYYNSITSLNENINVVNKISTLIKRDFRGYLLSNVISYIDKVCKRYCSQVFGTEDISFILDGNNISISYMGKEYESLSGGERQRIDLIVQLSIRDMLCKFLNFSCNLIVLDEITDNLDDIGCQKILNLISNELRDVDNIYIISHRFESLSIPYDQIITVVKDQNGISYVSV